MQVCVVQYTCLFGVLRENALGAHDISYAGHYEKSLCSDNDLRCHSRKMKLISSDWIVLLRMFIITLNMQRSFRYWCIRSLYLLIGVFKFCSTHVATAWNLRCVNGFTNVHIGLDLGSPHWFGSTLWCREPHCHCRWGVNTDIQGRSQTSYTTPM